jgi:hypothetical protein
MREDACRQMSGAAVWAHMFLHTVVAELVKERTHGGLVREYMQQSVQCRLFRLCTHAAERGTVIQQ